MTRAWVLTDNEIEELPHDHLPHPLEHLVQWPRHPLVPHKGLSLVINLQTYAEHKQAQTYSYCQIATNVQASSHSANRVPYWLQCGTKPCTCTCLSTPIHMYIHMYVHFVEHFLQCNLNNALISLSSEQRTWDYILQLECCFNVLQLARHYVCMHSFASTTLKNHLNQMIATINTKYSNYFLLYDIAIGWGRIMDWKSHLIDIGHFALCNCMYTS